MFSPLAFLNIHLTKILAMLTACLLGWGMWQNYHISRLKLENNQQAETISQLEEVQQKLKHALVQEQQAVISQQNIATALQQKAEAKREQVKVILKKEPCASTVLPRAVIEQLQK